MLALGIILLIAGLGSTIYGVIQNNSIEAQLTSLFSSGSTNPGTVFLIVGIAAAVIGVVLIVVSCVKRSNANKQ